MRRNQLIMIVLGLLGLVLIVWAVLGMTRGNGNQDRLRDDQLNRTSAPEPGDRCGAQGTYDLVKRELFRQAAVTRGSDASAFGSLAAYASIRVDAPVLKRNDEDVGTIVCSGRVAIDLPPGVAVVGGRRTLITDLDYAIQPAADGRGDVVSLSGAEGIVAPLATLARIGQPAPRDPVTNEVAPQVDIPGQPIGTTPPPAPVAPPASAAEAPEPAAEASARPSFNCRYARTRGEIAVCEDSGLASLDRQMASQYVSALREAGSEERRLLQQTRTRFLAYRDSCPNDSCIAAAYRGRIREIGDIMEGRWVSPR